MAGFVEKKDRTIIPRWRSYIESSDFGELSEPHISASAEKPNPNLLEKLILEWRKNKSLLHATDLLGAAFVIGHAELARDAQEFILANGSDLDRDIASAMLPVDGEQAQSADRPSEPDSAFREHIHRLRNTLNAYPRDSIAWVDLALAYTTRGLLTHAKRAINIAVGLQSSNRFVLRSAARFFVHVSEIDRAHYLLSKSEATVRDPWLLAAELALSSAINKTSKFTKVATSLIDDASFHQFHLSELQGALATLKLRNGSVKQAVKLFRRALIAPTENTVAQAEWAADQLGHFKLNDSSLAVPRSYEARAWSAFVATDWLRAKDWAVRWLDDQSFSSRPAQLASSISATLLEDFEASKAIIRRGLMPNPGDPVLLNNMAFACANLGDLDGASSYLNQIKASALIGGPEIIVTATRGLIRFRCGDTIEGRRFYERAISLAERHENFVKHKIVAQIYLAREELRAQTPIASAAVSRATKSARSINSGDINFLINRLARLGAAAH